MARGARGTGGRLLPNPTAAVNAVAMPYSAHRTAGAALLVVAASDSGAPSMVLAMCPMPRCAATCTEHLSCVGTTPGCAPRRTTRSPTTTSCATLRWELYMYLPPVPVILVLHGWTMTMDHMQLVTDMDAKVSQSGRGGAIVVYADGTGSGIESCWQSRAFRTLAGAPTRASTTWGLSARSSIT